MANVLLTAGIPKDFYPVTPNDSADNVKASSQEDVIGLYVEGEGDIVVTTSAGVDRTIYVASGAYIPLKSFTRVKLTGTTATGIFSLII